MAESLSFDRSQAMAERMRRCEALVHAKPGLFYGQAERLGGYPLFVERAAGCRLWDVDGNELVDYLLGYGSVILGHADQRVESAVATALMSGANPSLLNLHHLALAERLVEILPGVDLVTFLRTGSDAVAAAVRLARAVTGRKHVIHWGMHGWHDWCCAATDGILPENADYLHRFSYNDLNSAEQLFAAHSGDVACIVMMPYELELPQPGYLSKLRDLAHRNGALLIFDEVRSGFRIAVGGAQEKFGIEADLCAYSKAIGNGHAISALGGKQEIMQEILKLGLTVTFYRAPDSMAAALATIDALQTSDCLPQIEAIGERLKSGLSEAIVSAGLAGRAIGHGATPFVEFLHGPESTRQRALRRFSNGMLERGFLMPCTNHWFICAATDAATVDRTVETAHAVMVQMASEGWC